MTNNDDIKPELKKYIGAKIRELRKSKGMTQTELGDLLGLKNNSISAIERGVNSFDANMIFTIAKIFDVKADDLFPPTDLDPEPYKDLYTFVKNIDGLSPEEMFFCKELMEKIAGLDDKRKKKFIENMRFVWNHFDIVYSDDE